MTMTSNRLPVVTPADWVAGPKQGSWTYNDYAALPDDGKRYEIVDGVLYMAPAPSWPHQEIVLEIAAYLREHVRNTGLGGVFVAPVDVELTTKKVFQPDVVVLLKANRDKLTGDHIVGAPDLVVEVSSPGTETYDRHKKLVAYARAGVPEYWIVDTEAKTVEVLILVDGEYRSQAVYRGQVVLNSRVLPGFEVPVGQFFVSVWS